MPAALTFDDFILEVSIDGLYMSIMENPPKKLMIWKFPPYVFVNYVIPAQGD